MNYYFKFLELIRSSLNKAIQELDLDTKWFLDEIAINCFKEKLMTVGDAVALSHIGSSTTLNRKITALLHADLISLDYKGTDRRTKYIHLTPLTTSYYKNLSDRIKIEMHIQ